MLPIILFASPGPMVICKGLRAVLAHGKYTGKLAISSNGNHSDIVALISHFAFKLFNSHLPFSQPEHQI